MNWEACRSWRFTRCSWLPCFWSSVGVVYRPLYHCEAEWPWFGDRTGIDWWIVHPAVDVGWFEHCWMYQHIIIIIINYLYIIFLYTYTYIYNTYIYIHIYIYIYIYINIYIYIYKHIYIYIQTYIFTYINIYIYTSNLLNLRTID